MPTTKIPRITIVMPCFNGKKYLEKALEAFCSQDYSNKRLVIVDGKSTDGSHEIITKYAQNNPSVIWDQTSDTGISNAINIGLSYLDESDIFGYLGSDDMLMPDILKTVSFMLNIAPDLDGVYFDCYNYFCDTKKMVYRKCPVTTFSLKNLLKLGTIAGLQNIYIRGQYVLSNKFLETNRYSMDYELYLRLTKSGVENFMYIPQPSSVNFMNGNISTKYAIQGSLETIQAAILHSGYTPELIQRLIRLKLGQIKRSILRKS